MCPHAFCNERGQSFVGSGSRFHFCSDISSLIEEKNWNGNVVRVKYLSSQLKLDAISNPWEEKSSCSKRQNRIFFERNLFSLRKIIIIDHIVYNKVVRDRIFVRCCRTLELFANAKFLRVFRLRQARKNLCTIFVWSQRDYTKWILFTFSLVCDGFSFVVCWFCVQGSELELVMEDEAVLEKLTWFETVSVQTRDPNFLPSSDWSPRCRQWTSSDALERPTFAYVSLAMH